MCLKTLDELFEKVKSGESSKRMAIAVAEDEHTLEAALKVRKEGVADPILIGDEDKIRKIISDMGEDFPEGQIINEEDHDEAAAIAVRLVNENKVDLLMKGKLNTANLIRAVIDKETGLLAEGELLSLLTISELPRYHKLLFSSDAGIVANPTLEQKAGIIRNAVKTMKSLGYTEPRIAVLAAIEDVNPKMQETVDAAELTEMNRRGEIEGCIIEGPVSMDIALNRDKARIKGYKGQISGEVDMLIWPNVVTGNITQKALVEFAGLRNVSFTVGAKVPIVTTSRGATLEQKYSSIIVAAAAANTSLKNDK